MIAYEGRLGMGGPTVSCLEATRPELLHCSSSDVSLCRVSYIQSGCALMTWPATAKVASIGQVIPGFRVSAVVLKSCVCRNLQGTGRLWNLIA